MRTIQYSLALAWLVGGLVLPASAQESGGDSTASFHGDLVSVQMIDAQTGWAAGKSGNAAFLLQTHDGGKSWRDISAQPIHAKRPLSSAEADEAVSFWLFDAKHGWAAFTSDVTGSGLLTEVLFSTGDGGQSWQRCSFKTGVGSIADIQFVDQQHGFMLVESDAALGSSQKAMFRTTDGGKTWRGASEASSARTTEGSLPRTGFSEGMVFRNATDGWVTGSPRGDQPAFFFRTRNGGKTWQPVDIKPPPGFFRGYAEISTPKFFGSKKIDGILRVHFIQHDPELSEVACYRTHDGGEHWERTGSLPTDGKGEEATQIFFDTKLGLGLTGTRLSTTRDGGATWQESETNLRLGERESISEIEFVNPTQGWLMKCILRDDNEYELLQTVDGGRTWTHCYGAQTSPAQP